MNRINGWQRIGIVLSVAWVLSVGGYGAFEHVKGGETYYFVDTVKVNLPQAKDLVGHGPFSDEEVFGYRIERHFKFDRLIAAMLVPVALFWVLAYICVYVARWIMAGFRKNNP